MDVAATSDIKTEAVRAVQPAEERGHLVGPADNTFVAHCHHYNCFLQKTLRSRSGIGMDEVLVNVSASLFFLTFMQAFESGWTLEQRLAYAEVFFRARGYGNPRVREVLESDLITATASHHSEGYKSKFGEQDEPQDFFLTGALKGALTAAFGADVEVEQEQCMAMGDDHNAWRITRHREQQDEIERYIEQARRLGARRDAMTLAPKPEALPVPPVTSSVRDMELVGDEENGLIPAFNRGYLI